jgi:hypothetical protein
MSSHLERRFPATKLRIESCALPAPNAVQKRRTKPQKQQQEHPPIMIIADLANIINFEEPLKVATMKSKFITMMCHASIWFAAFNSKVSKHTK